MYSSINGGSKIIKSEMRKYFEMNKNNNRTHQNMHNAVKAVLSRKFTGENIF